MLYDVLEYMYPVLKIELCTTGKELQNYETQSFYRTAGIPAMLLFREPFAPEYK